MRRNFILAKRAWCKERSKEYIRYKAAGFRTEIPNIDIRHKDNFTKFRKSDITAREVPYWGTMEDIVD